MISLYTRLWYRFGMFGLSPSYREKTGRDALKAIAITCETRVETTATILALIVGFSVDDVLHALQDGELTLEHRHQPREDNIIFLF